MYTAQKENDTTHLPKKVMKQLLENYCLSVFHLLSNLDGIIEESCELPLSSQKKEQLQTTVLALLMVPYDRSPNQEICRESFTMGTREYMLSSFSRLPYLMGSLPICLALWVSAIEQYYFNTVCKNRGSIDLNNLMQFLKDMAKI